LAFAAIWPSLGPHSVQGKSKCPEFDHLSGSCEDPGLRVSSKPPGPTNSNWSLIKSIRQRKPLSDFMPRRAGS
jgi:hypothetical protein